MSSPSPPSRLPASHPEVLAKQRAVRASAAALIELCKEAQGWKIIENKQGCIIRVKEGVGEVHSVFMGSGIANAPIAVCTELLMNTEKKPQYDSMFDLAVLIEEYTDHIKVENHKYWAPPLIGKRDLLLLLNKARLEDGSVVLTARSTTHSKCPVDPKYIRAEVFQGGWILTPVAGDPSKTSLVMVASTDLKGSMPAAIKYRLACKQPALVREIAPLLQKRLDELSKMSPDARILAQTQLDELVSVLPLYTQAELMDALLQVAIENESKQQE